MRLHLPKADKRYPLGLVDLARLFRKRLPESELPYYAAYMTHLGRDDFVSAAKISEERSDPLLWAESSPSQYKNVRQAYSVCEKITCEGDVQATERAWLKFKSCEDSCRRTNRKIRYLRLFPFRWRNVTRGAFGFFEVRRMQDEVSRILGDFWSAYTEIVQAMAFGPGMSISSTDASKTSVPFKLSDEVTVTKSALPVWRDCLKFGGILPAWVSFHSTGSALKVRERVQIVPGCRITFVPKTSVIKRTIAIEPSANVSIQLAVHRYLKKRLLRKANVDLSDQSRNRSLALHGSLTGDVATIDLSSASDLISKEVVKLLLPKEWFNFLDAIRSHEGSYTDSTVTFEKFSSMGNGFTFALETLLFLVISKAAGGWESADLPSVYGDDIIVRTQAYDNTVKYLRAFGFRVNTRKSFAHGPFRESCGLDAFRGVDVRPVFLRGKTLKLVELFAFHNHCYRRGLFDVCEYVRKSVPVRYHLFGPVGPEAGFFFTEDPDVLRRFRRTTEKSRAMQTFSYLNIVEKGVRMRYHESVLLNASLYDGGIYSSGAPLRSVTRLVTVATLRDY